LHSLQAKYDQLHKDFTQTVSERQDLTVKYQGLKDTVSKKEKLLLDCQAKLPKLLDEK